MRLFASILLVVGLLLMPVAMTGHAASAMEPATAQVPSCPDHHEPAGPSAPQKGMAHCMMCAALPQPEFGAVRHVMVVNRSGDAVAPPRLAGVTPAVSDPPPKSG